MDDAEQDLVRRLLRDGLTTPEEARLAMGYDPAGGNAVILDPANGFTKVDISRVDDYVATINAEMKAIVDDMNRVIYSEPTSDLDDDEPEHIGLRSMIAEPDPLDEILDAAGIPNNSPAALRRLTDPWHA